MTATRMFMMVLLFFVTSGICVVTGSTHIQTDPLALDNAAIAPG